MKSRGKIGARGGAATRVRLFGGIMSGTSGDGVDIAFVEFAGAGKTASLSFRGFHSVPFPPSLRRRVLAAGEADLVRKEDLARLSMGLGEFYARALEDALASLGIASAAVEAVGLHGQTVGHFPRKRRAFRRAVSATLQVGEPSFIPLRTGIPAVSDFRTADVAAGGQGAPLAPAFHALLLAGKGRFGAIQNLGGIGNVTVVGGGRVLAAFDTGPANMPIDAAAAILTRGRMRMDRDGEMARRGRVDEGFLLRLVRADGFLAAPPPKSTGRERYGAAASARIVARARAAGLSPEDTVATLTAYAAEGVRISFERFILPRWPVREVFLCGGGAKNPALFAEIARRLPEVAVRSVEALGIPPEYVEAAAFAWLARLALLGRPGNVPEATGGAPAVLGRISPAPGRSS